MSFASAVTIAALSFKLRMRKRRMFGPIVFLPRSAAMWLAVEALPPLPTVKTCFSFRYARKSISPISARRSLQLPVPMEKSAHSVGVACTEPVTELIRKVPHRLERRNRGAVADRSSLSFEHLFGGAVAPREVEEQRPVETLERPGRQDNWLDADAATVWQKFDQVQPADCRRVLILAADRLPENLDLDLARLLGEPRRRFVHTLKGVESVQEPDGYSARRAEARPAGGDVGERHDVYTARNARRLHRLAD